MKLNNKFIIERNMEHSLQIIQENDDSSLALAGPSFTVQHFSVSQFIAHIRQLSPPYQPNLRLDSQRLAVDQSQPNLGLQLQAVNDQVPTTSFQVNSQKRQDFLIELDSLLNEQFKGKSTKPTLKKKKCSKTHHCCICQQKVRRKSMIYQLKCKHIYHPRCLDNWRARKNNCPLCRSKLI